LIPIILGNYVSIFSSAQEIDYSIPFDFLSSEEYSSDMDMFLDQNKDSESIADSAYFVDKIKPNILLENEKMPDSDYNDNTRLTQSDQMMIDNLENKLSDESDSTGPNNNNNPNMIKDDDLNNGDIKDTEPSDEDVVKVPKTSGEKLAIINFDDSWSSQFNSATPILDKYQFKGTFYIICDSIGGKNKMTWEQIHTLQAEGHEIGSHTMGHENLDTISSSAKIHEIVDSKKCIEAEGINVNGFSYPFNSGDDNRETLDLVSNNYDFARTAGGHDGSNNFGKYDGYERYTIIGWSHDAERKENNYSDMQMFNVFTDYLDRFGDQSTKTEGIPIIIYHNIDDDVGSYNTSIDLFEAEMQYLYENGFKVNTMNEVFG